LEISRQKAPSGRSPASAWRRLLRSPAAILAACTLVAIVAVCLLAPVYASQIAHTGPDANHVTATVAVSGKRVDVVSPTGVPVGPTWVSRFLLGADPNGRDVAVRLLYGGRNSLEIAAIATLMTIVLAVAVALLAGWFGGVADALLSRSMDLIWSYPVLLLGVALGVTLAVSGIDLGFTTIHGGSLLLPALIIGVVYVPYMARPLRAQTIELGRREFVDAARQQGLSAPRIMLGELLPNLSSSIVVFAPLLLANSILLESGLSFLGAGVQAPAPSWGTMIAEGTRLMPAAIHLVLAPGLMLLAAVVSANVLAEAARDALDPRHRGLRIRTVVGGLDRSPPTPPAEHATATAIGAVEGEPA
jgi:peptide/nickel transport system permease protein